MANPNFFVHELAICESMTVGSGTKVAEFSRVFPWAKIGRDCNLFSGVVIGNGVEVGDRVIVSSGAQLWDGVRILDDVFIGPNATLSNDHSLGIKENPASCPQIVVEEGASIGANATILPGVRIGRGAIVGAGSVVNRDVPGFAEVFGNPAHIRGYVHPGLELSSYPGQPSLSASAPSLSVPDVSVVQLTQAIDLRGSLVAGQVGSQLPFPVKRFFVVYDVPSEEVRGAHAHRECHQFLIAIGGSVKVIVTDGQVSDEVVLDNPRFGLHLPPMIWGIQYEYTPSASLLVIASHEYDPDDYIRDYSSFVAEKFAGEN